MNAELKGRVEISGTANTDNFDYYKFEYRREGVSKWATLQTFQEPVTDGLLGVWDTSTLSAGDYWFRLEVVREDGNYKRCEVPVTIVTTIPP